MRFPVLTRQAAAGLWLCERRRSEVTRRTPVFIPFSVRHGHTPPRVGFQSDSIDDDLRISLWNALQLIYWEHVEVDWSHPGRPAFSESAPDIWHLFRSLWMNLFKLPIDKLPDHWGKALDDLRGRVLGGAWYEVYDILEYIAQDDANHRRREALVKTCNMLLEREMSAYRFLGSTIAPIVANEEIASVEEALCSQYATVDAHLSRAVELLSDRKSPDYRNSVKESISAVEAIVRAATDSPKGTLGDLLKKHGEKRGIHPALKDAFEKLYGYTSDESGIRHALVDGAGEIGFDEAKFMLVACSAFVNYVKGTLDSVPTAP